MVESDYKERIRPDILASLERYVKYGIETGDFLRACLENNLSEAVGRADEYNYSTLAEIVTFIHWDIPAVCHGSKEKVRGWLALDWTEARKEFKKEGK